MKQARGCASQHDDPDTCSTLTRVVLNETPEDWETWLHLAGSLQYPLSGRTK